MSNVVNGTMPTIEPIKGNINVAYGAEGKSAYELAVKNGFEGSEEEWVKSLKGDTGNSGVFLGSGDMPDDCNVQIDPDGDISLINQVFDVCNSAHEKAQEALDKSEEANEKYGACVEATVNANAAAENANAVREEIEAGGYIESLKELNEGEKFSFWVGTQAEYDAISEKVRNCFYIITDDIEQSKDYAGCYYRIVNDKTEWINPPMIAGVEYRTTERKDGNPVYVKRISTSYQEHIGNNDGLTDIEIEHGVSNLTKLIRCEAIANNIAQLPFFSTTGGITSVNTIDNTNIVLRIYKDVWSPSTFVFDIAYTKEV